jgi:CRISPR-associated protein Cmr2
MTQSFLVLSIGPVQGFIVQARRAGDLYAGSQLLAKLVGVALNILEKEGRGNLDYQILYPSLQAESSQPQSLPNKLMALVPNEQAETTARHLEQAIKDRWQELADAAKNKLGDYAKPDPTWQKVWEAQINQLPEIYWTVTLLNNERYKDAYEQAGRDFDARKRLRNFGPIEEIGPKCTICGERSAMHRENEKARDYWAEVSRQVSEAKLRPNGKERLCAVCAVKRFGEFGQEHFPSASYIAATPFKKAVLEQMGQNELNLDIHSGLGSAIEQHTQMLLALGVTKVPKDVIPALASIPIGSLWEKLVNKFLNYDGEWLYPETYDRLLVEPGKLSPENIRPAQQATERLLGATKGLSPSHPGPYYAILYADGDNMSNLMRSAAQKPEKHTEISRTLAEFAATEARDIMENQHVGRVIYAGGDDVVALLPITKALAAVNKLRKAYNQKMGKLLTNPTMSAGIALVHHLSPLGLALQAAREAESAAKQRFGRNAVAVALRKRSGEAMLVGASWAKEGQETVIALEEIYGAFVAKELSASIGYTLLEESYFLEVDNPDRKLGDKGQEAEIKRLFTRASNLAQREERDAQAERFTQILLKLAASIKKGDDSVSKMADDGRADKCSEKGDAAESALTLAARWLILMRFLAQEGGGHE